jgi:hypothetical protein
LSDEIGPLIGTLKSGQTLRGMFDVGGGETKLARAGTSFQFPLTNAPSAPESNILASAASTAACPGLTGGSQQTPQAAGGQLCLYVTADGGEVKGLKFDEGSVSRLGFGLEASFEAIGNRFIQGFWAVTAP